jgi:outer membrane protein assembly factor BamB
MAGLSRHTGSATASVLLALLLSVLVCSCEGLQIARSMKQDPSGWITFGGSLTRTNQSASIVNPPLHEIWQYDAGSGITATPLVKDSVLIICTLKGELHAVNAQTGKRIGYITLDGAVTGTPVWNGVSLYVPISTENETVEAVDLTNGSKDWRAKLGQSESSPLLYDRDLYVTSLNGSLLCINRVNGEEVWKYETGTKDTRKPIRSSPATDGNVIVFGCDDGVVYAVDRTKGAEKWKFETAQSIFASPIIARGRVIVGSLNGKVYCLSSDTGNLIWSYDTHSSVFGSASSNDSLAFVGTTDGHCYALDLQNGSMVWKFRAGSVINSAPLITRGFLYVGSLDKNLYVLDVRTGREVWHFEARGRIKVSPVIWNGTLLVTSEDNYVTALR